MIIRSHPKLHRLRSFFQDYTVAYYPDMPSKFGELLLRMPELQRVCQVAILKFKHIQTLPLTFSLSLFSSSSSCSHPRPDCCSPMFLWPCPCPLSLSHPLDLHPGGKGDAVPLPTASRGGGRRARLQLPHGASPGRPLAPCHLQLLL